VLYVDHTAACEHGGFAIATTSRCIKATTSFSRFRFELAPTAEAEHLVSEEATYTTSLSEPSALQELLDRDEASLVGAGALTPDDAAELHALVRRRELLAALASLGRVDEHVKESVVQRWVADGSPLPAALVDKVSHCVQQHAQLTQLAAQADAQNAHIQTTLSDQARLRQNIESLEKVGKCALLTRYLNDLDRGEDDILARRVHIGKLGEREAAVRASLKQLRVEVDTHVSQLRAENDLRA